MYWLSNHNDICFKGEKNVYLRILFLYNMLLCLSTECIHECRQYTIKPCQYVQVVKIKASLLFSNNLTIMITSCK